MFFVIGLPVLIILVIGTVTNSFQGFRVGVVNLDDSATSTRLIDALSASDALDVSLFSNDDVAAKSLRRSELDSVVVIHDGYEEKLSAGDTASVSVLGERSDESQRAARAAVSSIVAAEGGRLQAAQFVANRAGGDVLDRLALADQVERTFAATEVDLEAVDAVSSSLPAGYTYSAPTMLVLFVFINCLAAGAAIIQSRELRLYERMLAGPVKASTIVAGETLAYFGLAMVQSLLIVVVGAVFFGVGWGNAPAAVSLVAVWGLVGTGAGVLAGTVFRTAEQAGSIGPAVGIACGMLGGCMWPLEIVPPVMRTIGHVVPHGWAVDAWTLVIGEGSGVSGIAEQLAVLVAFAAVLLGLSAWRLKGALVA